MTNRKLLNRAYAAIAVCIALAATSAKADSTTTANTTTATAASAQSSLLDHFTATYVAEYYGGPLSGPLRSAQPGPTSINGIFPQEVENIFGLFYKLNSDVKVGLQAHYFYRPVLGQDLQMYDPLLQISDKSIYRRGNFNLAGYLRFYLPLTSESTADGMNRKLQYRAFLNPTYSIPHSIVTVGLYSYFEQAFYGANSAGANPQVILYAGPNVAFQVLPKLAITALYEMTAYHNNNNPKTMDLTTITGGTDFEPGLSWEMTPNISVNPFLNIYTGNSVNTDTTNVNLLLVAKLF